MAREVSPERKLLYEEALRLISGGESLKDACEIVGLKAPSLLRHIRANDIPYERPKCFLPKKYHEEIISGYISGESSTTLSKKFKCSKDTILDLLRSAGVEIKSHYDLKFYKDGYSIDRNAFADTGQEVAAYLCGWLVTDGNLCKNRISLQVKDCDEYVVGLLKEYVGTSNPILRVSRADSRTGKTYNSSQVYFSDEVIKNRLSLLGLEPRKSLNETCPEVYKNSPHFWRGALEGDGHISKTEYRVSLVGGICFVTSFMEYCTSLGVRSSVRKHGNLFYCTVSYKDGCKTLLDTLYIGSTYKLPRKYTVYRDRYGN